MKRRRRPIRIYEAKLGRQHAWGLSVKAEGVVIVDPRQGGRRYLDTLIHEVLHVVAPDWGETRISRTARRLTQALWSVGYRKVSLR